ncbi:MAG: clostripain-related cysteine peptidase, partial [Candidatus Promineifilaceae bacterium]
VAEPTIDPNLAAWTLLIYMDADNNLEPYALADLDEIAANAASLQDVNVVVQVDRAEGYVVSEPDWTDTQRFTIEAGKWVEVESIGEVEMGRTDELAKFLDWGLNNYPATHTALIMWGHGSGWLGMSTDGVLGNDGLSLTNLEEALQLGLAQTDRQSLDLIGFDACLMGQLDVFAAVQNYASVAVASEDLIPGGGWDYAGLLQQMTSAPIDNASQLGTAIVETYQSRYTADGINDVTLSAVDLSKFDDVTNALAQLSAEMLQDIAVHAPVIADSRRGGGRLASNYGKSQDLIGAIDFGRFASILTQLSVDPALRSAAQQAVVAIDDAVILSSHGSDIEFSEGIGLYFPNRPTAYNAAYAGATAVSGWNDLLTAFYDLSLPAPNLTVTSAPEAGSEINAQNPAFIGYELVGQQIEEVALLIGRYEPDGRQLLLEFDHLIPEPTLLTDGSELAVWRDGVHSDFFVWDTEVTYLTDGEQGEFVIMWPTAPNSTQFAVQGLYAFANGGDSVPAALTFDHRTNELVSVWGGAVTAVSQIVPQEGDQFQPYRWYIEEGRFSTELGETMSVSALSYANRPVDEGDYFMGFRAESITGAQSNASVDLTLTNNNVEAGYNGYLDPYLGFQFLYPEEWIRPIYGEFGSTLLYTSDLSGTVSFQVKLYQSDELAVGEQATPLSAEAIRADALNQWVNVSLLYEDTTTVVGEIAVQTVYGYQTAEAQRTGMFFTFVHDGAGYLVDIDMPAVDEATMIEAANMLIESWSFQPVGVGLDPTRWTTLIADEDELLIPAGYVYEPLENGWERYRQTERADTFFAFRRDALTGR